MSNVETLLAELPESPSLLFLRIAATQARDLENLRAEVELRDLIGRLSLSAAERKSLISRLESLADGRERLRSRLLQSGPRPPRSGRSPRKRRAASK